MHQRLVFGLMFVAALALGCEQLKDLGEDDAGVDAGADAGSDAGLSLCPGSVPAGSFCDARDGKVYRKATIGTQTWMAQNLDYAAVGSHCHGDQDGNCVKYGRLYQWAAVMAGGSGTDAAPSAVRGICPTGWHVPSKAEWLTLNTTAGTSNAGTKLKVAAMDGTDDYGFGVLGSGYALDSGGGPQYAYENTDANYWTTSEIDSSKAWHVFFFKGSATMGVADSDTKLFHYSLRCVQD